MLYGSLFWTKYSAFFHLIVILVHCQWLHETFPDYLDCTLIHKEYYLPLLLPELFEEGPCLRPLLSRDHG